MIGYVAIVISGSILRIDVFDQQTWLGFHGDLWDLDKLLQITPTNRVEKREYIYNI
jgi:hypothetical protein